MNIIDHRILGSWELVSWTISLGDQTSHPFGENPLGRILYTPDGQMSAAIARHDRARLSSPVPSKAPSAEKFAAFDSYFSYGGAFRIEGGDVVHTVELSLNPNFVGTEQRRHMTFGGGPSGEENLTLSADEDTPNGTRHHRLCWKRVAG